MVGKSEAGICQGAERTRRLGGMSMQGGGGVDDPRGNAVDRDGALWNRAYMPCAHNLTGGSRGGWWDVKESCVSVCWQQGWQSRVTARLGLTGGNGGSGVSAAFAVFTGEAGAPGVSARMIRGARILCLTVVTSGFVP